MRQVNIREVKMEDAPAIAKLSLQMDHDMTEEEAKERIAKILEDETQILFVADVDGEVMGYNSVSANYELLNGIQARIEGLVVDESTRGMGVGRMLMEEAEEWAREKGSKSVKLGSNVKRVEAHKFYEKIGYTRAKEQAAFKKVL
jgi:ribosomal protein S18 acetylase RimI-like enzyme